MSTIFTCPVREQTILLELESELEVDEGRNYELWRANTYTTKEPDTLDWIDRFFQPGEVIYDIGANIGQYSLYAGKKLGRQATILAFEPEALNFAQLNKNIILNELGQVILPYCLAVAERMKLDRFYSKAFAPGAALHAVGRPITQGDVPFEPQNQQGAMVVAIDDLTQGLAAPFPNHIKVDVDGIELEIVQGAESTLADSRLKTVLIEVYMHKNIAEQIQAIFTRHGFDLYNEAEIDYSLGNVQNLIFMRKEMG